MILLAFATDSISTNSRKTNPRILCAKTYRDINPPNLRHKCKILSQKEKISNVGSVKLLGFLQTNKEKE